jgi:hypothetical protein
MTAAGSGARSRNSNRRATSRGRAVCAAIFTASAPASAACRANPINRSTPGVVRKSWNDASTATPPAFASRTTASIPRSDRISTSTTEAEGNSSNKAARRATTPIAFWPPSPGCRAVTIHGNPHSTIPVPRQSALHSRKSTLAPPIVLAASSAPRESTIPTIRRPEFFNIRLKF